MKNDPDITADEYEESIRQAVQPFIDRGNNWTIMFWVVSDNAYDKLDPNEEVKLASRISGHRLEDDEQVFLEVHVQIENGEITSYKTL